MVRKILADKSRPREERCDALKFLLHLVDDAHQPFRARDHEDWGGNKVELLSRTDIKPELTAA